MTDPVQQAKHVLGIEDSDDQKKADIQKKVEAGESTDRERLELEDIEQKEKQLEE